MNISPASAFLRPRMRSAQCSGAIRGCWEALCGPSVLIDLIRGLAPPFASPGLPGDMVMAEKSRPALTSVHCVDVNYFSNRHEASELESLGTVFYEPLWLFYRSELRGTGLDGLRGRKISIGPEGSGTRALSLELLKQNGIDQQTVVETSLNWITTILLTFLSGGKP